MTNFSAIILAAGKGTRMKSALPKPLHAIAHKPMLGYVIDAYKAAGAKEIVVVISPDDKKTPSLFTDVSFAIQHEQKGTGHAALIGLEALKNSGDKIIIALGDQPFVSNETIQTTLSRDEVITVVAMQPQDPAKYGRLITDGTGALLRITEYKDATEEERKINLCNAYPICFAAEHARHLLAQLKPNNAAKEFYLTDAIEIANSQDHRCGYFVAPLEESLAANTREELSSLETIVQTKLRKQAMDNGATLLDPQSVFFAHDTKIGKDVIIEPNVFFGPGVTIGDNVQIMAFSHIVDATIEDECEVGPFARISYGTHMERRARIGNFVETKKAHWGERATAKHLSYIGNAKLGKHVNIGAGTVICNYDGFEKHEAVIHDHVLIGSNNTLVSPIEIGKNAITAGGSTLTENVSEDALALGRSKQMEKPGWAAAFRSKKQALKEKK